MSQSVTAASSELSSLVSIEAWSNPRFQDQVRQEPTRTVKELAARHGIAVPEGLAFEVLYDATTTAPAREGVQRIVIGANPAGDAPSEIQGTDPRALRDGMRLHRTFDPASRKMVPTNISTTCGGCSGT